MRNQCETNKCDKLLEIVALSITFDLVRYLAWQLTIWVFAFKYWVISIEMPKAIKLTYQRSLCLMNPDMVKSIEDTKTNQVLNDSERKYTIGLWVGVTINLVLVVNYIVFYGKELMTKTYASEDVFSYCSMNFCGLVSGCFLGDALRRIYNTFKDCRGLQ